MYFKLFNVCSAPVRVFTTKYVLHSPDPIVLTFTIKIQVSADFILKILIAKGAKSYTYVILFLLCLFAEIETSLYQMKKKCHGSLVKCRFCSFSNPKCMRVLR